MVQRSVLFTYLICCRMNRGVTAFGGLEIPKIVQTLIHVSRLLYIYISDLLEYLLCSDVRLNRLIYYDKRHVLFCLDLILILCWQQITSSLGIILVNKTY